LARPTNGDLAYTALTFSSRCFSIAARALLKSV